MARKKSLSPVGFIQELVLFILKAPTKKLHFILFRLIPVAVLLLIFFLVFYFYSYSQPETLMNDYFQNLKKGGGYLVQSWDCISSKCQKEKFINRNDFKERHVGAQIQDLVLSKKYGLDFFDLFPKTRDFVVTFKKQEPVGIENLNQKRGLWLLAKDYRTYFQVSNTGNPANLNTEFSITYQLQKFPDIGNKWKIIGIDTASVKVIY